MTATESEDGVFVSYRRRGSKGHTGRIHDRLAEHFGKPDAEMLIKQ